MKYQHMQGDTHEYTLNKSTIQQNNIHIIYNIYISIHLYSMKKKQNEKKGINKERKKRK